MNVFNKVNVFFKKLHTGAVPPAYAHDVFEDAGADLVSVEDVDLWPGKPVAVGTGLAVEIPPGFELQIRPRSGLALKHAVTVANAPGTVDPGYRGEVKVMLVNLGTDVYHVKAGDRIAQAVLAEYAAARYLEAQELTESDRGEGGFGSSGH